MITGSNGPGDNFIKSDIIRNKPGANSSSVAPVRQVTRLDRIKESRKGARTMSGEQRKMKMKRNECRGSGGQGLSLYLRRHGRCDCVATVDYEQWGSAVAARPEYRSVPGHCQPPPPPSAPAHARTWVR
ncbi:hypothetical protein J6590_039271 [Homalodisca vitripennis]|nr:hypothetical protein J6590_039271 [Homalodisca vitripennis]